VTLRQCQCGGIYRGGRVRCICASAPPSGALERQPSIEVTDTGKAALTTQPTLADRLIAFRDACNDLRQRLPIYVARGQQQLVDDLVKDFAEELADLERLLVEAIRAGKVAA
jgi:hypothetical protein